MRWEKDEDYVEIALGLDVDLGAIWFVESTLDWTELPIAFRDRIGQSDKESVERLKAAIESWADRKGFE
jgi:hypothetical protein